MRKWEFVLLLLLRLDLWACQGLICLFLLILMMKLQALRISGCVMFFWPVEAGLFFLLLLLLPLGPARVCLFLLLLELDPI